MENQGLKVKFETNKETYEEEALFGVLVTVDTIVEEKGVQSFRFHNNVYMTDGNQAAAMSMQLVNLAKEFVAGFGDESFKKDLMRDLRGILDGNN